MKERKDIIHEAVHECFKEMYAKSQPSIDYDELVEKFRNGEITECSNDYIHDRYYLSMEEFMYIKGKYINMYRMNNFWESNLKFLRDYLTEGGYKDLYVPERTDEDGFTHPGYRSAETVPNLKEIFLDVLDKKFKFGDELREPIAEELYNVVLETIDGCRDFYRFDREENEFSISVALGASPTSNKDKVINYWKEQGIELNIVDRNPLLLWEMDYYGDEFEEVMKDEYGDDWEQYWWDQYKIEQEQKKMQEILKKLNLEDSLARDLQEDKEKGGKNEQL